MGLSAIISLYRITNQWPEFLAWYAQHRQIVERYPQFLGFALRALGETGDIRGLVELYDRCRQRMGKHLPAAARDQCRLMLFAFCGRRAAVERLFAGSLAVLPESAQAFWLATADWAAGSGEAARRQLEALLSGAELSLRQAVERRLSQLSTPPPPPTGAAQHIVAEAERETDHEEKFAAPRTLFSRRARATQVLIALNVLMFFLEAAPGGSENGEVLYRLGVLVPPAVYAGEWWRLAASTFLHFGALHLAMNMVALWILGPFVEFALGLRRFLLVYLVSGICGMATVLAVSFGASNEITVGASGCIMGLIGATGALMLRGWVREGAAVAKRRLGAVLAIVAMQTVFDSLVPQVSMTAHLSGAFFGFVMTMLVRDRLRAATA